MLDRAIKALIVFAFALIVMTVYTLPAGAVEDMQSFNQEYDKAQTPAAGSTSLGWEAVKMVLVLGLIVAAAWSVIRFFNHQTKRKMQGNWLHIADEVMLGQNRGVVLCEVGQRLYALGVTDHSISYLFEVDNPQVLKEISQQDFEQTAGPENLKNIKRNLLNLVGNRTEPSQKNEQFHQLMREQVDRMKGMPVPGPGTPGNKGRSNADQKRT